MCSPTPTRSSWAKSRSTFIRSVSPPANCGATKHRRATRYTSICGTTILTQPEPIFAEPWEAQAFALAVKLSEQGFFTWKEWSEALVAEIKAGADRSYYQNWLHALDRKSTRLNSSH